MSFFRGWLDGDEKEHSNVRLFFFVFCHSIHFDVQLCQWLQTVDDQLKLGDFNRAQFPLFDPAKQEYCKEYESQGYGNYRSPEEYANQGVDEKIDVWSFGNNIYALLTGLWIFYEDQDDDVVQVWIYSVLIDVPTNNLGP